MDRVAIVERSAEHPADLQKGIKSVPSKAPLSEQGAVYLENASFLRENYDLNPRFARKESLGRAERLTNLIERTDLRIEMLQDALEVANTKHGLYSRFRQLSERQKTLQGGFAGFIQREIEAGRTPNDERLLEDTARTPYGNRYQDFYYSSRTNYARHAQSVQANLAQFEEYRKMLGEAQRIYNETGMRTK